MQTCYYLLQICSSESAGRSRGRPGVVWRSDDLLQRHRRFHHDLGTQHSATSRLTSQRPLHCLRLHHRRLRRLQGVRRSVSVSPVSWLDTFFLYCSHSSASVFLLPRWRRRTALPPHFMHRQWQRQT